MRTSSLCVCALLIALVAGSQARQLQQGSNKGTSQGSTQGSTSTGGSKGTSTGATQGGSTSQGASKGNATLSLADAVRLAPSANLSILIKAVEAANLTGPLFNSSTTWTIFAPNDAAFNTLISALGTTQAKFLADKPLLTKVLSYHVVPGVAATAASLKDGEKLLTLLKGKNILVSKPPKTPGVVLLSNPSPLSGKTEPAAKVIVPDIKAGKSEIHVIDRVLLP